ncbi:unnamed protein product [Bemisia tabaci]|uniref:Ribosome biogenesis regulatory protein n=1 Tax=Bemisia tabaci TaxID=7038 RepID=A0A9P0A5L0_BEMTA|nr:unnamed protein product [Bemisia tabaci]
MITDFRTIDIVDKAFKEVAAKKEKFKPTTVFKLLPLETDVGTLLAVDPNDLNSEELRNNREDYLKELARDNTQLLLNEVWELPSERVDDVIVAKLPKPKYLLPRELPVPKPKPLTKYQQYALKKGLPLKKTKKHKMNVTWDEILKKWVPNYGYKHAQAEKERETVIEVPDNVDPMTDMFAKKEAEKRERVSKNEFQRLRNIARAANIKVPHVGVPAVESRLKPDQLELAAVASKSATASAGVFQPSISADKTLKSWAKPPGVPKQKLKPVSGRAEKEINLNILEDVMRHRGSGGVSEKAVNRQIAQEQRQVHAEKMKSRKKGRGGRTGGGKGGKKGPKGGKDFGGKGVKAGKVGKGGKKGKGKR